jgi:internalin A
MSYEEALVKIRRAARTDATKLDLRELGLTELSLEIGQLIGLQSLDLSGNQLTELPPEVIQLTGLQELYLSSNQLTELPPEIIQLTGLQELSLSGNQLTELPPEVVQLTELQELYLGDNQLIELPPEIVQLVGLQELDLSGNQLIEMPLEIIQLTGLQYLSLSNNQLRELPPEIVQLATLRDLNLSGNQLTELLPEIGWLTGLQSLDLSNNQLTELPSEIGQLTGLQSLDLSGNQLTELPPEIGQLAALQSLDLGSNQLVRLPPEIGRLVRLHRLYLSGNQLRELPPEIVQVATLRELILSGNQLTELPSEINQLTGLQELFLSNNQLTELPPEIGQLTGLQSLDLGGNQLTELSSEIGRLATLQGLYLSSNQLRDLPPEIGQLTGLQSLNLSGNQLVKLPPEIGRLATLHRLYLSDNQLVKLPPEIGRLATLHRLYLSDNQLTKLPPEIGQLAALRELILTGNPLNPALRSAYDQGPDALWAYLLSLKDAETLYEAKLVLVGEGGVGKTTLLKALTGRDPREGEPTTHGVEIDIESIHLPHPEKDGVEIQFNAWDFGGQEVYRVTHQFFFSRRSVYLLVWEPRLGVQQCQVEDWLKMIRLRVGADARVIVVSTHSKTGKHIARIDEPIFRRDFGVMIAGFHEVDSLVDDPKTGEKVGVARLKEMIAKAAKDLEDLEQIGIPFNRNWREARDELLIIDAPRISYDEFAAVCEKHSLGAIDTRTLAGLMHDLGYVVYYGDDECLRDDVVLQPEWLTKAISFVLEDRITQEMDGVLPDGRLRDVWQNHSFEGEPRYDPELYPFFLRLMERYDVSYRLKEGDASLVAQHVPQVRPDLPWQPEDEPVPGQRRIAMTCVMDEVPPGLVPWMIVRTHEYAYEQACAGGQKHRLYWQKGMFLRNPPHGQAMLELRGRELHVHTQAVWPEYFTNVIRQTVQKLIADNWPGLKERYYFAVPCPERSNGDACKGRFDIEALSQFLNEGDRTYRCQVCHKRHNIVELLYGFEEEDTRQQLSQIEAKIDRGFEEVQAELAGLDSRIANYVMAIMRAVADEGKQGPRLFTIVPLDGDWRQLVKKRYKLHLWCEAEGCQHPVVVDGKGIYEFTATREWIIKAAPYINFIGGVLRTVVPLVTPAVDVIFGPDTIKGLGITDHLSLIKGLTGRLKGDVEIVEQPIAHQGMLTEAERSGVLALHALLRDLDPTQKNLGLKRVPTYTGDYRWLCPYHYEQAQPKIPDRIE